MARASLFVTLLTSACGFGGSTDGGADAGASGDTMQPVDWLAGYAYRKRIDVAPGGTSTLTDFPIAIAVTDADLAAHARSDGADLIVTHGDGLTVLDSELVAFGGGAVELWTRMPSLPASSSIYLYYGGPAITTSTGVWSAQFAGVWHMGNPGAATYDSTVRHHALLPVSMTGTPQPVPGIIGTALALDGADDGLEGSEPTENNQLAAPSFSYSTWVYQLSSVGQYDMPFYRGGANASNPGYCMMLGSGTWHAKVHDGTRYYDPSFGEESELGNTWVHLVAVVDRGASTLTTYTNGAKLDQMSLTPLGSLASSEPIMIGRGSESPFRGWIDEVRIYDVALTADWIATEYANHTSPGFLTFGPEQTR